MALDWSILLPCLAIGVFVGISSNIFGLGGGVLITPILPLFFKISQHDLIATALACIFIVVSVNVVSFARKQLVVWPLVWPYGMMAALGSVASGLLAQFLSEQFLRVLTFIVLIFFIFRLLKPVSTLTALHQKPLVFLPYSFFAGSATGLTGIGTGAILSPLFLAHRLVESIKVSPTTNAILMMATFMGVLSYAYMAIQAQRSIFEAIQLVYVLPLCVGALSISGWARKLQNRISDTRRRRSMAFLLCLLALLVLYSILKNNVA